ncbi:DUF998 domain-containing protein [Lysobacter cavernae]|uniref:DUF998 domain-containing protein n=1 Tax=Lysobacter cavernae TaxID=1685901 RepID=A0ABV7RSG1_9GAMM
MRRLATAVLAGLLVFVVVCVAVQLLRDDLDWWLAPLSFYLVGDYGSWLQGAYLVLAGALAMLGAGYYAALPAPARSAAPLLLFVLAALALGVTAMAETDRPQRPPTFEGLVHGIAASTAFLCVTTAMLLQSWRFRGDAQWRPRFVQAFGLAMICFVAMWVHALWREAPRGLSQKLVIAAIVAWLVLAAFWLRRASAVGPHNSSNP